MPKTGAGGGRKFGVGTSKGAGINRRKQSTFMKNRAAVKTIGGIKPGGRR